MRPGRLKRILVMRLDRIGDVLLSTPLFSALKAAYPKSHIAVMVRPYSKDIVEGNPYIDEVILYDKDSREKGVLATLDFIWKLRRKRFDLVLVLHPTNRSHAIAYLAGIPVRVGYDKKLGKLLLTKAIPHTKHLGLRHESDYVLNILRYIGVEPLSKGLYMPLKAESERKIERLFKADGLGPERPVVVIHPGASCPSKKWPPERFAEVANRLTGRLKARIVVIAGLKEKALGDKVAALIKGDPLNISGETSVADLASLIKRSQLLVSNDSGPVHVACALGTPVVVIFGRSDAGLSPERWGPLGARNAMLHKYVGCGVCLAHNCAKGFECLTAVTPDEVFDSCVKVIDAKEAAVLQ